MTESSCRQNFKVFRICSALVVHIFRLLVDLNCEDEISLKMLSLEDKPNHLAEMLVDMDANHLRSVFPSISTIGSVSIWFPEMSLHDLYFYVQGYYQLKYCSSRTSLRLNNNVAVFHNVSSI